MTLIARKMRQKRPLTESELHDVCRQAQRDNVEAQARIAKLVKSNDRARAIILDFFFHPKKYKKGGMTKGQVTSKGSWLIVALEELREFIEREKAKGLPKKRAEHAGAEALCKDWANSEAELGLKREGVILTPQRLLNAWKRGGVRKKLEPLDPWEVADLWGQQD